MLKQHRRGMSKLLVLLYTAALLTGHWMPIGFAKVDAPTPVPVPVEDDGPTVVSPGKPTDPSITPPSSGEEGVGQSGIKPPSQVEVEASKDKTKWQTYKDTKTGLNIKYPNNWSLMVKSGHSVVTGFDAFLLSSFDISLLNAGSTYVPDGHAVIGIDFMGSDYNSKTALIDYLDQQSLLDDRITRSNITLNKRKVVKGVQEGGTSYALANGQNVYSVYSFSDNNEAYQSVVESIVAELTFTSSEKISYPSDAKSAPTGDLGRGTKKRLSETTSKLLTVSSPEAMTTLSTQGVTSLPSMKLPWGAGQKKYNAGPHNGLSTSRNCAAAAAQPLSSMNSLDFGFSNGQEVVSVADGIVAYTSNMDQGALGKIVAIDHAGGLRTLYAHLSDAGIVVAGQSVRQGMVIGKSGCSGSGCIPPHYHLHFELRNQDDTQYSAHGTVIDGYRFRTFVRKSDGKGWNYDGTATKGVESTPGVSHCSAASTKWTGSATVENWGNLTSTNQAIPKCAITNTIGGSCFIAGRHTLSGNLEINNNSTVWVTSSGMLDMNFASSRLLVRAGSKLYLYDGGKVN